MPLKNRDSAWEAIDEKVRAANHGRILSESPGNRRASPTDQKLLILCTFSSLRCVKMHKTIFSGAAPQTPLYPSYNLPSQISHNHGKHNQNQQAPKPKQTSAQTIQQTIKTKNKRTKKNSKAISNIPSMSVFSMFY